MEGRKERHIKMLQQGQVKPFDVSVNDIELRCLFCHVGKQRGASSGRVVLGAAQPLGARNRRHELCAGDRVTAGEQRDLMTPIKQLFGQPVDHALGPAVELRRHALCERGDLRDTHGGLRALYFAEP